MGTIDKKKNQEIDLLKLGKMLLGKSWLIILFMVVGGCLAISYTLCFVTPMYKSSVTMYVNNNTGRENATNVSNADLTASAKLVDTYGAIIQSNAVLNQVITQSGKSISSDRLKRRISMGSINNTEVFVVSVIDESPEMAATLAMNIANTVIYEIPMIIEGTSVKIIDNPVVPRSICSPNYVRNTELGILLGFVICVAVLVLCYLFDRSIKSVEDFEQWDYPVLAAVPDLDEAGHSHYGYGYGHKKSKKKEEGE